MLEVDTKISMEYKATCVYHFAFFQIKGSSLVDLNGPKSVSTPESAPVIKMPVTQNIVIPVSVCYMLCSEVFGQCSVMCKTSVHCYFII